jgi:hypothetical protein
MPAKAAAGHCQQKQDPTEERLDQGITEYSLNTLANPLHESPICPKAWGLHHVSQAKGDLSSVALIRT